MERAKGEEEICAARQKFQLYAQKFLNMLKIGFCVFCVTSDSEDSAALERPRSAGEDNVMDMAGCAGRGIIRHVLCSLVRPRLRWENNASMVVGHRGIPDPDG